MKLVLFVLFAIVLAAKSTVAQLPPNAQMLTEQISFNIQGHVTDSMGTNLTGTHNMEFRIYEDSTGGTSVYNSGTVQVTFNNGVYTHVAGVSEIVITKLSNAGWLEVTIEGEILLPRRRIGVSLYAYYARSVVGPGSTVTADGAIAAGTNNRARGLYSTVAGGGGATPADSNLAAGDYSTVGGGSGNRAGASSAVGVVKAAMSTGYYATVGGGRSNNASGDYSTASGGYGNNAADDYATVAGGDDNGAVGLYSMVGGGKENLASNIYSTVAGGLDNSASNGSATVGGGQYDTASGQNATVGGGYHNVASGSWSTVCGGEGNKASASISFVGGGNSNTASGDYSNVGGGLNNVASYDHAVVGGGLGNVASNKQSCVPGGAFNAARGGFSFAAGDRAKANHDGSVVIAADTGFAAGDSTASGGKGQMVLRATGAFFLTNANTGTATYDPAKLINTPSGAHLTAGGTWTNASDRNKKENFTPIDGKELLEKLQKFPITMWNYKTDSKDVKHIGPVAQDFYALFGLGSDDKTISTIDPAGVALATIKALNAENHELKERLTKLEEIVKSIAAKKDNSSGDKSIGKLK